MPISNQLPTVPDYFVNIPSPIESFGGGYKIGAMMLQARQQQELQQQELDRQTQLKALMGKTNATAEDYSKLAMLMPPEQSKALRDSYAMQTEAQSASNLKIGGQVMAAFYAGQPQIGIQLLNDRALAARNSGQEPEAKAFETWAKLAEINPTLAQNTIGTMLATMPGGDKTIISAIAMSGEARTAQADTKFRELMAGANTVEDVFARIPKLSQLGEKGVEHAERLLTQQRLMEQQKDVTATAKAKRGETQIESIKATQLLNTLIAGTSKETPAFVVDKDGEVTENESFWAKYAFIPTAGGPDQAVPGTPQQRPAAPVFDSAKAAALGLDQSTLELVKAQIELDPKLGAKLLSQIIGANIKAKLKGVDRAKLSSFGQQLVDEGLQPGAPDFNRRMAEFNRANVVGKAKGDGTQLTIGQVKAENSAGTEMGKLFDQWYDSATAGNQQLRDMDIYEAEISKAITGPMAGARLKGAQIATMLGLGGDEAVGSTRALIQGMSEMTLSARGMLKGQGAITDREQEMLQRARGGDISMTPAELKILFGAVRRGVKAKTDRDTAMLKRAAGKGSDIAAQYVDEIETGAYHPQAPRPSAATVSVKAPDGKIYTFPNQQAADQFKRATGAK